MPNAEIRFALLLLTMCAILGGWAWLVIVFRVWLKRRLIGLVARRLYGGPAPRARFGCDDCGAPVEPDRLWVARKDGEVLTQGSDIRRLITELKAMGPAAVDAVLRFGPPPPSRHQWWCPLIPRLMLVRTQIENGVPLSTAERRAKESSEERG